MALPDFKKLEQNKTAVPAWIKDLGEGAHHNLLFDDGTPADERLPDGVTGWIRRICETAKGE